MKEVPIPFATVHVPADTFSQAQKHIVIAGVTDLLVEVEQREAVRPYVNVLVVEGADGG
ncbi:tautomerase family protein [Nonomuraea sp. NPDC049695]|uniref:tautomerase family protein n=1 Tax=Nonomuraea sp. NPDC049695 TaxID=3154734 RepID=UPI00341DEE11